MIGTVSEQREHRGSSARSKGAHKVKHEDHRGQHSVPLQANIPMFFFSCHPPKLLIRKSAIRARSGASTLKDQQLGRVTGEKKNGERGARPAPPPRLPPCAVTSHREKKKGQSSASLSKMTNAICEFSLSSHTSSPCVFSAEFFRRVAGARNFEAKHCDRDSHPTTTKNYQSHTHTVQPATRIHSVSFM